MRKSNTNPLDLAKKTYSDFQGKKSKSVKRVADYRPETLVILGRAVKITYECSKKNGVDPRFAGKKNLFVHELDRDALLYYDPKGRVLLIRSDKLTVKKSGING